MEPILLAYLGIALMVAFQESVVLMELLFAVMLQWVL